MTEDWRQRLRASGHRLTPQRELVLAAVTELHHATPEEVLQHVRERSSAVNISTVYRTLEVLESIGLVRHTHLTDRSPTYHTVGGAEHFHLVCRECRTVRSVETSVAAELVSRLSEEFGFVADVGHLAVFGHCEVCPEDPASQEEPEES